MRALDAPAMIQVQRVLPYLAGALLCACASSGSASGSNSMLVTLRDFKSGKRFELASESHTQRVSYYSGARTEATRKVQSDEIMAALAQELARQGLEQHAQAGRAPTLGTGDRVSWALELEQGSSTRHWLVGKGSAPGEWQEFQRCRDTFLQLYNITVSFQTVQNGSGKGYFDERAPATDTKRP